MDYDRNLLKTQLEIQEHTFQNISREIHDNISLSLTLAKLNLNTLDLSDKKKSMMSVDNSIELIGNAINDLSDISKSLNTEAICSHGLIAALQIEIEKIRRCGKHQVDFVISGNPVFLDPQKELVLFRITQEALNNVLKHAKASIINLQLNYNPNCIDLRVEDNGIGFRQDQPKLQESKKMPAGLNNMTTRAGLINGTCEIKSKLHSGTTISVTAPF